MRVARDSHTDESYVGSREKLPTLPVSVNPAPSFPVKGSIAYDTLTDSIYYANDQIWQPIGGGGGITGLTTQNEGDPTGPANSVTTLNFVGTGVNATQVGDVTTVTISSTAYSSFAMFYGLTTGAGNAGPNDYASSIVPGSSIPFPRVGPSFGPGGSIYQQTSSIFGLGPIGTYEVSFEIHTTEPGQLQLSINGNPLDYSTAVNMNPTSGGHPIQGKCYVTTTSTDSFLRVFYPQANTPALTVTPADSASTRANAARLCIARIN